MLNFEGSELEEFLSNLNWVKDPLPIFREFGLPFQRTNAWRWVRENFLYEEFFESLDLCFELFEIFFAIDLFSQSFDFNFSNSSTEFPGGNRAQPAPGPKEIAHTKGEGEIARNSPRGESRAP